MINLTPFLIGLLMSFLISFSLSFYYSRRIGDLIRKIKKLEMEKANSIPRALVCEHIAFLKDNQGGLVCICNQCGKKEGPLFTMPVTTELKEV